MSGVRFPAEFRLVRLERQPQRRAFSSGQAKVDDWLATKALQHQDKHLSTTKVLLDDKNLITGYYTLATGQVDFGDLPLEIARKLPRRMLPVAVLAWLGVVRSRQGQGIGRRLLAQALRECYEASLAFAFVAVLVDCIDDPAVSFYQHFGFAKLPGHPYRMFLGVQALAAMMMNRG